VNNYFVLIFFFPYFTLTQTHYIRPVNFFDYYLTFQNQQVYFHLQPYEISNNYLLEYQNKLFPHHKPIPIVQNPSEIFLIDTSTQHLLGHKIINYHPSFFILNGMELCHDYLVHNQEYVFNRGIKEIEIFKNATPQSLPPHLFYKNKPKITYSDKVCYLDFSKIKPGDVLRICSEQDSIFIPVMSEKYPDLTLRDSIEAMVYILTKSEYRFLKKVNKKSYLNFVWSGFDEENQMNLKELYFKRVYEANIFFTELWEGWKTERGMIYIIFGKPSAIVIYDGYEDWFYERTQLNDRPVYFRFKLHHTFPYKTEYILERKPEYYDIWNDAIDAWRHGLIIKEK
jgi:GWxTD domain-containing protein